VLVQPLLELPGGGSLGGLESEVLGRLSLSEPEGLPESEDRDGSLPRPLPLGGTITLPDGPSLLGEPLEGEPLREWLLDPLRDELCEEEPDADDLLADEELSERITEPEREPLSELIDELPLLDGPLLEAEDALSAGPDVLDSLLELELELPELLPSQHRHPSDK